MTEITATRAQVIEDVNVVADGKAINEKIAQKIYEGAYKCGEGVSNKMEKFLNPIEGNKDSMKEKIQNELDGHVRKLGKDGVEMFSTGDILVRDEGRQILFMPNGDKLTINKDGSYDLKNLSGVRVNSRDGVTTLKYGNGDMVQFDDEGIHTIQRGDQGVIFGRMRGINKSNGDTPDKSPGSRSVHGDWPSSEQGSDRSSSDKHGRRAYPNDASPSSTLPQKKKH